MEAACAVIVKLMHRLPMEDDDVAGWVL